MDLKDIMDSVDIVEYISQYVDLTQRGSEYWGLSPFKSEKTPSFSVRRETNSWYDFSSGLGGNIITFIKYYFNVSSRDAVNMLKKYVMHLPLNILVINIKVNLWEKIYFGHLE